jgi:hypothetical protein
MLVEQSGMSRTRRGWLIVITGTLSVLSGVSAYRLMRTPEPFAGPLVAMGEAEAFAKSTPAVVVYKSATCECCGRWVEHLEHAGLRVSVQVVENLAETKTRLGIPASLGSCHSATVWGYAIEGHVPIDAIQRLLTERHDLVGLAVPGMPAGSPGMESSTPPESYQVMAFGRDRRTATWLTVNPAFRP